MGSDEREMMSMEEAIALVKPVPGSVPRGETQVPTKDAAVPDVDGKTGEERIPWRNSADQREQVEAAPGEEAPPQDKPPLFDQRTLAAKEAEIAALERELAEARRERFESELAALPEDERAARRMDYLERELRDKELRLERQQIRHLYPGATALFGLVAPELSLTVEDANQLRGVYEKMDERFSSFLSAYREEVTKQVEAQLQEEYAQAWGATGRLALGSVSPSAVNAGGGPKAPAVMDYEQAAKRAAETGSEADIQAMLAARGRVARMQAGR